MMRTLLRKRALMVVVWTGLLATAAAEEVDWTALNPGFAGATFVNDAGACEECHDDAMLTYQHTEHGRAFAYGPKGELQKRNCEACHGPRNKHAEADDPDDSLALTPAQTSQVCLQCHQDGARLNWQGSLHAATDVQCVSCHRVMEPQRVNGLLNQSTELATCSECHADVQSQMLKASHHPVREGKMSCSSCHDPHGSVGRSLLQKSTVNETCFDCHQEKRGPFLWEHPVAREDCATCHTPHGSNNADLLNAKGAFLCMQCHSYGGHINLPRYNRVSNPYGQGCVNCHSTQHGSNHPSGAKFTR
ncbi:MAG: DmsE family decaheme c-type cytochrome [Candidatus Schekmanbacteria bacterium]|nr:DmsE family decaheme c-type cytochrome [Candidatus Schekmanbacteria bacterium]